MIAAKDYDAAPRILLLCQNKRIRLTESLGGTPHGAVLEFGHKLFLHIR
jgi:hypothetical protein